MPERIQRNNEDERSPERKGDLGAQKTDIERQPSQLQSETAGHGAELQRLSSTEEAAGASLEELAENDQSLEAESVEGVEDAGNHPERPAHTHGDYGHTDDVPPAKREDEAA